jgi:hypothetical protein
MLPRLSDHNRATGSFAIFLYYPKRKSRKMGSSNPGLAVWFFLSALPTPGQDIAGGPNDDYGPCRAWHEAREVQVLSPGIRRAEG